MANLKELREESGKLVADARKLNEAAEKENRDLTGEEQKHFDELLEKGISIREQIQKEERLQDLERKNAEEAAATAEARAKEAKDNPESEEAKAVAVRATFQGFLRNGIIRGDGAKEFRALSADADVEGGFLLTPKEVVQGFLKAVDDAVFIRSLATVRQIPNAQSLGIPTLDTDPADADWTAEILTGSEDSSMAFGQRELNPSPLAKRIKVSNKLLRMDNNVEGLVMGRLAYKFGISEEKAFLTGHGANQPLGIFTASADGISTGRDVSADNTTTEIKFDGLINAKFTLKGQYHRMARWIFHRDAVKQIAKLKDGEGQYIWRQSVREGEPDRILDFPFDMSEYAPNTFTTGLYVGILGDFSNYWIADALNMQMQRLVELYAETNQTGFIGRLETDGMPVLEEAFIRVTLA